MPSCVLCGSESFDEFDGLFYCENCGTQSQEIRNEAAVEEELDDGFFKTSQHRRQMKKKRSSSARRSKYTPTDFGKPWLTFEAFQCLLKAQVSALIKLGVNPSLKDVAQQIWFRFLEKKKVAFTGAKEGSGVAFSFMKSKRDLQPGTSSSPLPGQDSKYKAKKTRKEDLDLDFWGDEQEDYEQEDEQTENQGEADEKLSDGSMSDSHSDSDSTDHESVEKKEEHIGSLKCQTENSQGWSRLQHKPLTVVIVYLGLLYANEPITLADLLRLIEKGLVPYYKISDVLPGHMKFSKEDVKCFHDLLVRAPTTHEGAAFIINFLGLPPIPEPDLQLMMAKLVMDLQLPSAVFRLSLSLLKASGFKPRVNFNRVRNVTCTEFYEEMVMSFLIVALKLIYGLDGIRERSGKLIESCLDVGAGSLECWGCIALRLKNKKEAFIQDNYPSKESELKSVEDCTNYSLFCAQEIFKNFKANQASKILNKDVHSQIRACRNEATEMYADIMTEAVDDLNTGKPIELAKLSCSSFIYKRIERQYENVSCKCGAMVKNGESLLKKNSKDIQIGCNDEVGNTKENLVNKGASKEERSAVGSYLIYLDDLSNLNVHDSYKFLLNICADRIFLRPNEMHYYVQQVECMLFVLDNE